MAPKNEVVASLSAIAAAKKTAASFQPPKKNFEHIKPILRDEESDSSSDSDSDESIDAGATKDLFSKLNGTSKPLLSKPKDINSKAPVKNLPSKKDQTESESESDSDFESEDEDDSSSKEGSGAKTDHKGSITAQAKEKESDSENESEEGSEEESSSGDEDEAPKRTTQKPVAGGPRVKPESESESETDESESESSESKAESEHNDEEVRKPKATKSINEDIDMVDDSSESSESEETTAEQRKMKVPAKTNGKSSAKAPKSSEIVEADSTDEEEEEEEEVESERENEGVKPASDGTAVIPFQLKGSGFQVGPVIDQDTSKISKMFKEAKALGQQVWYFTAPETIPVTVIQKMAIDMNKAKEGKGFLTHNGDSYTMAGGDTSLSKEIKLVVADKTLRVDQVYHLEQVRTISAPKVKPDTAKRTPRPQPKNLKPRCPPIGISDRNLGTIDPDGTDKEEEEESIKMADPPPIRSSPEAHRKAKERKKAKKRKHSEAPEASEAASPTTKKLRIEDLPSTPVSIIPASVAAKMAAQVDGTPVQAPKVSTQPTFSTEPVVDVPDKVPSTIKKKKTPILPPPSSTVKQTPILPPFPKINSLLSSQKASSPVETPTKNPTSHKKSKILATDTNAAVEPEAPGPSSTSAPTAEPDTPRKSTETTEANHIGKVKKSRKRSGKNKLTSNVLGDLPKHRQVTPIDPPYVPGMPMKK